MSTPFTPPETVAKAMHEDAAIIAWRMATAVLAFPAAPDNLTIWRWRAGLAQEVWHASNCIGILALCAIASPEEPEGEFVDINRPPDPVLECIRVSQFHGLAISVNIDSIDRSSMKKYLQKSPDYSTAPFPYPRWWTWAAGEVEEKNLPSWWVTPPAAIARPMPTSVADIMRLYSFSEAVVHTAEVQEKDLREQASRELGQHHRTTLAASGSLPPRTGKAAQQPAQGGGGR